MNEILLHFGGHRINKNNQNIYIYSMSSEETQKPKMLSFCFNDPATKDWLFAVFSFKKPSTYYIWWSDLVTRSIGNMRSAGANSYRSLGKSLIAFPQTLQVSTNPVIFPNKFHKLLYTFLVVQLLNKILINEFNCIMRLRTKHVYIEIHDSHDASKYTQLFA